MTIPSATTLVGECAASTANGPIRRPTEESVSYYAAAGREAIERRLQELDREWDIERALEASTAGLTLAAVLLGLAWNRKWLVLPGVIAGLLVQHAVQGRCAPLSLLRRREYRAKADINRERCALKALRGDFREVEPATNEQIQQKAAVALRAADR